MHVSERTVYRIIERGELKADKSQGVWTIIGGENVEADMSDINAQLVRQLQDKDDEIEYLRQELSRANETIANDRQRSDTIVAQLTQQNQLLLEDMRTRSLWIRIKTVFAH